MNTPFAMLAVLLPVSVLAIQAEPVPSKAIAHRFLAFGGQTRIVEEDGRTSWTYPESSRDGQLLANGHILLVLSQPFGYPTATHL